VYAPIIATLGFVMSPDGRQTLLVHRNKRADDAHLGKFNGLGGKLEANEDVVSGLQREIMEEAGISCLDIKLRGTVNWTGFGPGNEDWLGFIFRIDSFSGEPYMENEEGTLIWHPAAALADLPMWEGDRYFLPLVFDDDRRQFHGYMPYAHGRPLSWSYVRV